MIVFFLKIQCHVPMFSRVHKNTSKLKFVGNMKNAVSSFKMESVAEPIVGGAHYRKTIIRPKIQTWKKELRPQIFAGFWKVLKVIYTKMFPISVLCTLQDRILIRILKIQINVDIPRSSGLFMTLRIIWEQRSATLAQGSPGLFIIL